MRWTVLSLLLLSTPGISQETRDVNEVVSVRTGDSAMEAAIRKARNTLDDFLKLAADPPAETSDYKLKVLIKDGEAIEHFWVIPFRQIDKGFEGVLANEPRVVDNVRSGQLVRFSRSQITDWGYVRSGRQVGSFTVCVLFSKMPEEQAAYYRDNYGFDC